jgi:hypothetical protein
VQQQDVAVPIRKGADSAFEIDRLAAGLSVGRDVVRHRLQRSLPRRFAATIDEDADEPGPYRGASREPCAGTRRPHPGFLHRILRARGVEQPHRQQIERGCMGAVQGTERLFVAVGGESMEQLLIGGFSQGFFGDWTRSATIFSNQRSFPF